MEYLEGESLADLIRREKRLSPEKAIRLMAAICSGVSAAHQKGIIHRDLKPMNIVILKNADSLNTAVKILDFGLAKIKSIALLGSFVQAQTKGLMGSPYYMSPEQWGEQEPTESMDIYSLGVILYEMLTGEVPFKGSSFPSICQKHLNSLPTPLGELGIAAPKRLEVILRYALEKNPSKRISSAEAMGNALVNVLNAPLPATSSTTKVSPTNKADQGIIHIYANQSQIKVFVNNELVEKGSESAHIKIPNVYSGKINLRITKEGFKDYKRAIICKSGENQFVVALESNIQLVAETVATNASLQVTEKLIKLSPVSSDPNDDQSLPYATRLATKFEMKVLETKRPNLRRKDLKKAVSK